MKKIGTILLALTLISINVSGQEIKTKKKGGLVGFYSGKEKLLDHKYDHADHKYDGYYLVKRNNKVGVVSKKGLEIIPCHYDEIEGNPQKGYIVTRGEMSGAIDSSGKIVLEIMYDEIQYFYPDSLALVKYKGRWCNVIGDEYIYDTGQLLFTNPEMKPVFGECSVELTAKEYETCSQRNLLGYLYYNLKYPIDAVRNKIEGTIVIVFLISANGEVFNARIVRSIGGGCGEEALRVVNDMPNWTPAHQDGERVITKFVLPVKFKLK